VIPITIYERENNGNYSAKVSSVIISLLHPFMEMHPGVFELYPIGRVTRVFFSSLLSPPPPNIRHISIYRCIYLEPSLNPAVNQYKLQHPTALNWRTLELKPTLDGDTHTFTYTELTDFAIKQTLKSDARVGFSQGLHTFTFAIKLQVDC
jgi:hypothetical protein